ncbi:MAG: hypothetical protein WC960_02495 [Bacteroidales bacterium]
MRGGVLKLMLLLYIICLGFNCIYGNKRGVGTIEYHEERGELLNKLLSGVEIESLDPNYLEELSLFLDLLVNREIPFSREGLQQLLYYRIIDEWEYLSLLRLLLLKGSSTLSNQRVERVGVDSAKFALLTSLLSFTQKQTAPHPKNSTLLRASITPQLKKGYSPILESDYLANPESRYIGGRAHLYMQNRIALPPSLSLIITSEKDPGERGLDLFSLSLSLQKEGRIATNLMLGSYVVRAGEGVILWNGFSMANRFDPITAPKSEYLPSLYSSTDENRAFKGGAITLTHKLFRATYFLSYRGLDALLNNGGYTSLPNTGLHNTPRSIRGRGALKRGVTGLHLIYNPLRWRVGVVALYQRESLPYVGQESKEAETAQRYGKNRANLSLHFRGVISRHLLYGEAALDIAQRVALLTGFNYRFKSGASLLLTTNYIERGFSAPSSTLNFKGIGTPAYSVIYKKRTPKGKILGAGVEGVGGTLNLFFKGSSPLFKENGVLELLSTYGERRALLRLDLRHKISSNFSHHARGQIAFYRENNRHFGYNFHSELIYNIGDSPIGGSIRVALFDTPLWGVRLYSYERDLLNQIKTSLLYGKGVRWYINLKGRVGRRFEIWLKYAQFNYFDRTTIGQGKEQIEGSVKGELKVELRFKPA